MNQEMIDVSLSLPRILWQELQDYAQTEYENETSLLIRAIEQLLRQEISNSATQEMLAGEEEYLPTIETVVAQIKATPPNPQQIQRATKTIDEVMANWEEAST